MDRDATNVNERYLYDRAVYPAGNVGGFYRSMDRGATWAQVPWPLLPNWYGGIAGVATMSSAAACGSRLTPSNRPANQRAGA